MTRIVLLEDEPDLRQELAAFIENRGYALAQAGSLAEFWPLLPSAELAIIDIMLPDGSGLEAGAKLRALNPRAGIIILTARGAMRDKLAGFEVGADHYLVKPFRLLELGGIIDAMVRRLGTGWRLDTQHHDLIDAAGHTLRLSPSELMLFRLLVSQSDQVVSRRALVEGLGESWLHYDQRRLDTLISRLRSRWREISGQDMPLKTAYRKGYHFLAPITLL